VVPFLICCLVVGRDGAVSSLAVPASIHLLPFRLLIQKQLMRANRSITTLFRTAGDQVMRR
jgi:hypothetical protein